MRNSIRGLFVALVFATALTVWANPTQVYVNAAWSGPEHCGGHTWGTDAFASVQAGITAVAEGGTVTVAPGTYAEWLTVAKSVTLLGPHAGVIPNTPTTDDPFAANPARGTVGEEAVIMPPSTNLTIAGGTLVTVTANNVQIDGFTFDGDHPALPGGENSQGIDAMTAIGNHQGNAGGLLFSHNIFRHFARHAIHFENTAASNERMQATNAVLYNRFEQMPLHIPEAGYTVDDALTGTGVFTYDQLFTVSHNTMTGVDYGVDLRFSWHAAGMAPTISDNRIQAISRGIQMVLLHDRDIIGDPAAGLIDRNLVQLPPPVPGQQDHYGISIMYIEQDARVVVSDNTVSGGDAGIYLWELPTFPTGGVTITGGTITGSTYGLLFRNVFDNGEPGRESTVTVSGLRIIDPQAAGIALRDDPAGMGGVSATCQNVTIQQGPIGILLRGGRTALNGDVQLMNVVQAYVLEGNGATTPEPPAALR